MKGSKMRKIFTVFTATLLVILAGCGADAGDSSNVSSLQAQQKTEEPRAILKGTEFTYNGKPLKFGTSLDEWLPVIGAQQVDRVERDNFTGGRLFVFDKIGIVLSTPESDKTKVNLIQFILRRWPASITPLDGMGKTPGEGSNTVSLFKGYLEVDGVEIARYSTSSTVSEINRNLSKENSRYSLKCDRKTNTCWDMLAVDDHYVVIGAGVHVDSDGSIYTFGIGEEGQ
jgi:hypothetical protein